MFIKHCKLKHTKQIILAKVTNLNFIIELDLFLEWVKKEMKPLQRQVNNWSSVFDDNKFLDRLCHLPSNNKEDQNSLQWPKS